MSFDHPWLVPLAMAACLGFAAAYVHASRRRAGAVLRFSNLEFLIAAARPPRWPARLLAAAWISGVALAAIALTGPRAIASLPVRDGTIVLCVDTSGSMAATDVAPSRAQAAQEAMRSFIAGAPRGVAMAVVSFSGNAELIEPPSRDREENLAALERVPLANGATAIGDALALAQRTLPARGRRAVVLITDGENNAGADPYEAARALARAGVRVYTVGIGTGAGALVPGTLQEAGLDEDALRDYARMTGGEYRRAADAGELRQALASLGRTTTFERGRVDLALPSAVAGAFLMAAAFLSGVWTKSI